ncbi:MAG: D-alanyl-D-alanine carboxypeptidase [Acidimicrobiia bacterium]|nr:D-alanyl-D-alanine carboxypeptidase [Acidimicrobiia bacterium]MXY74901.1 D-alanyl-D-alanine carboxypeptidase [Acidimicrobiia bacterium]MYB78455.1 D-alanyl-D-alanine carboxypeptidase [Acidimicrobiia bacterium]MYD41599.1 D-alanyl-D-alanine carboxypeptidase [Acidimicrobiia bacterium]MYG92974.1 D-alanyl-D-alanine carboxypeptidase [Acidimicrobiia bacterium]
MAGRRRRACPGPAVRVRRCLGGYPSGLASGFPPGRVAPLNSATRLGLRVVCLATLLVAAMGATATASPLWIEPPPLPWTLVPDPPDLAAESWLLYDERHGVVLAEHNADQRRPMASTTKLMTALLAVEVGDLSSPVRVSEAAVSVGEAGVDLVEGEVFLLRTLVRALLIRSGNDAAQAVAESVGGSAREFVAMMNRRASEMGLVNTSYANAHGLDHPDQYTTARDLLTLTREALLYPELAEAVATRQISLRDSPDGQERVYTNTNQLLFEYEGTFGVKTGYTDDAGRVLVAGADRQGRRLLAVVMNAEDHFAEAATLLDYGFDSFGSVPGLAFADLKISRSGLLVESATPDLSADLPVETEEAPMEVVITREPVAIRVGEPPEGLADLLGWMLGIFSSQNS